MLPIVVVAMLLIVQVSLLVWDQLRVAHAAREGARVLSISNDADAAEQATLDAAALDPDRTSVTIQPSDRPVGTSSRVIVRYRPIVVVPFAGAFVSNLIVQASVAMRVERDPP